MALRAVAMLPVFPPGGHALHGCLTAAMPILSDQTGCGLMSYGLPRKLRVVFIVQVVLITLAVVIGAWLVGSVLKRGLFIELLREDAAYFWERYAEDPAVALPDSRRTRGVLVAPGQSVQSGPSGALALAPLTPGFHDLEHSGWLAWVEDGPGGRLYLLYDREHAGRLVWGVASGPLLLILLAGYWAAWYAYRAARDLIVPINALARWAAGWEPGGSEPHLLDPAKLGNEFKGEVRQLAQVLDAMAGRVRAHIRREHEFTRDASHELRTPLTVIRVATDMAMADPDIGPRQLRSLQRIARAGADMEEVIESQLLLAREAEASISLQQVDVEQVVREEVDKVRERIHSLDLAWKIDIRQPLWLETSPGALHVVIGHLLENACKYTPHGEITITLDGQELVITDTGIGMSSDQLSLVFEPFFRVNQTLAGGAGLGLSIVRRLCERFGWSVELQSQQGRGTIATLRLAPPARAVDAV
jgi:signal transduction histidine kinase